MEFHFDFLKERHVVEDYNHPGGDAPIFVDYGDQNTRNVFDHHSSLSLTSSSAIISSEEGMIRVRQIGEAAQSAGRDIVIVTHADPDLDSVFAAAQIRRIISGPEPLVDVLMNYIARNDQGFDANEEPICSLALLFQAIKDVCGEDDHRIMAQGEKLLEYLDDAIRKSSFSLSWNSLTEIPSLLDEFDQEIARLKIAHLEHQHLTANGAKCLLAMSTSPSNSRRLFKWVDGIILSFPANDKFPLGWKSAIRSDQRTSPSSTGYKFTAVYTESRSLPNYCLSLDPTCGCSLEGLGARLEFYEGKVSEDLENKKASWPEAITKVATNRAILNGDSDPTLIRDQKNTRPGYRNNDPWYDGRGHNFTIVDTPAAGTVLSPSQILEIVLNMYSPLWRESVQSNNVELSAMSLKEFKVSKVRGWLNSYGPFWDNAAESKADDTETGSQLFIADVLNSLCAYQANSSVKKHCLSLYIGVDSNGSIALPEEEPDLALRLALYLGTHGKRVNNSRYPHFEKLNAWFNKYCWQPIPGQYIAVSDQIFMTIDYSGSGAQKGIYPRLRDQYFESQRQLIWTSKLPPAIQRKKRYEAICEFIEQHSAE